jgi:hypothetical protein
MDREKNFTSKKGDLENKKRNYEEINQKEVSGKKNLEIAQKRDQNKKKHRNRVKVFFLVLKKIINKNLNIYNFFPYPLEFLSILKNFYSNFQTS